MTRHYPAVHNLVTCGRCGSLIASHRDDRGHWIGCPNELDTPRVCAFQGCASTLIEDVALWLCAEHLPSKTVGRRRE